MQTRYVTIDKNCIHNQVEELKLAGRLIREGELVAFPTETVYGLGADATNEEAVKSIFKAKGRPSDNPLIVHVADTGQIEALVSEINDNAKKLIDAFFPGSLTVIMKKKPSIPDCVTGGLDTVGIRCPESEVARAFLKEAGVGVAAPSANTSGKPSPTCAKHVKDDMDGKIAMIIDGGESDVGVESTVIDSTVNPPMILRPGKVTLEDIKKVIPDALYDPALNENKAVKNPKSPGMKYTHYAPEAQVTVVDGDADKVFNKIKSLIKCDVKTAVITLNKFNYDCDYVFEIDNGAADFAKELFALLRKCDELGVEEIYTENVSADGIGMAVRNRLYKAAGYRIIEV